MLKATQNTQIMQQATEHTAAYSYDILEPS